jgi:ATP-dependent exoDNAse (exonuclease V) beta subunit
MTVEKIQHPPTPEQTAAIERRDRDVFCEAGAGTGKTRVLVGRYCDALCGGEAGIDEILAFTFTERAAAELRQRIRRELGSRARAAAEAGNAALARELRTFARETERAWVTTIHGFASRLLRAHPIAAGLDPRFRVLNAPAAERLRAQAGDEAVAALTKEPGGEVARVAASYQGWRVARIALLAHERLRSQGMAAPRLPEVGEPRLSGSDDGTLSASQRRDAIAARDAIDAVLRELDRRYEELKGRRSSLDFADLELRALELLRSSDAVRQRWHGRFRHLMVDEFQDTNRVQLDLIDALRGPDTRLFTVGDEHQSIYRFRNADLEVFRAERRKAGAAANTDVLPLRGNFRSTAPILGAANLLGDALLEGFQPLVPGRKPTADTPAVEVLITLNEGRGKNHRKWADHADVLNLPPSETIAHTVAQARALAERLRELVGSEGVSAGDIVVLLRAFTHVDAYEEALRRYGLDPYVVGGRGYWSAQQVEDLLRLLATVANPLDDEMLFGALASPAVSVSPDAIWLLRAAAGEGRHVWPALDRGFGAGGDFELFDPDRLDAIGADDSHRLRTFCSRLGALRAEAPLLPLDALVERTMNAFDYDLALLARPQPDGRMANVRKLMRLAADFERDEGRDLRSFLAQAAESTKRDEREGLAPVQPEDHDGVRIMTVHGAKGLEFPVVAVPELDRPLDSGHDSADIRIGRPGPDGKDVRFGLRLAFPTEKSLGVWELTELDAEEKAAEAEESGRLVYVAVTRAQERLILSGAYRPADTESGDEPKTSDSTLKRVLPKLGERGWSGASELLDDGLPVRVRVSEPSDERARELTPPWREEGAGSELGLEGAAPPILPGERSAVPLGHLSYSALDAYRRCGYRFYLERVLGVSPGPLAFAAADGEASAPERADDEVGDPTAPMGAGATARALGNAVHAALEWSAHASWEAPSAELIAALCRREGLSGDSDAEARVGGLVEAWLASALCAEIKGEPARAEAPFALPLGGTVLRGNIDLLVQAASGPTVIDFKTDRLSGSTTQELGTRYAAQRSIYALAVAGIAAGQPVRTAHVFLQAPDEPVIEVFEAADLDEARSRLEGVVAQIRGGDFAPAADPYEALCLGCPAAPRLCPRPAWRPSRELAATLR